MNFLAHLYLSGESGDVKTGNFIGDFVKGREYMDYPDGIRDGILMHRHLDRFNDTHPAFKEIRKMLRPICHLYSGIVADLFTDHFLASGWNFYSGQPLSEFAESVYDLLLKNFSLLPRRVQQFMPVMIRHKRLESYATLEGIEDSLEIMRKHTSLQSDTMQIINLLQNQEQRQYLDIQFHSLMRDAILYVKTDFGVDIRVPV